MDGRRIGVPHMQLSQETSIVDTHWWVDTTRIVRFDRGVCLLILLDTFAGFVKAPPTKTEHHIWHCRNVRNAYGMPLALPNAE